MLLLARGLGPTGFGQFTFALTLATVFAVIPDYGFSLQIVRAIASGPERTHGLLRSAVQAKAILASIAVFAAVLWFLSRAPDAETATTVGLLFLSFLFLSFGQLNSYAFRGSDRFDLDAVSALALNLALLFAAGAAVIVTKSPVTVALAYLGARALYLVVTWRLLRGIPADAQGTPGPRPVAVLRDGFPYGVHTAASVLYVSIDTLVLEAYRGHAAVGIYQAGMRLVFASMFAPEILTSGLFPSFAKALARNDTGSAVTLARVMNRYMVLVGGTIVVALALVPDAVRGVLFGRAYSSVDSLLIWFGVVIVFRYVSSTYGAVITAAGAQSQRTMVGILAMLLSLGANLVLIPRFGIAGAVVASVTTHGVLLVAYGWLCQRAVGQLLVPRRAALCATLLGSTVLVGVTVGVEASVAVRLVGVALAAAVATTIVVTRQEWMSLLAMVSLSPRRAAR